MAWNSPSRVDTSSDGGPFEPPDTSGVREVPWIVPVGGQYDMFHENFKESHPEAAGAMLAEGTSGRGLPVMASAHPPGHSGAVIRAYEARGADDPPENAPGVVWDEEGLFAADPHGQEHLSPAVTHSFPDGSVGEGPRNGGSPAPRAMPDGSTSTGTPQGREVGFVVTDDGRRGRGIAPIMHQAGWVLGLNPLHSPDRTDEGLAFSRKVGGPDVRGYDQSDAVRTPRHYGTGSASDPAVQEALRLSQEDESGRPYAGEVEV